METVELSEESAPEPTWMDMLTPPEPVALAPRLGTPVILPGLRLEMPFWPVIKRVVGIAAPLTELALLLPVLLAPSEPAPEVFAPGNPSIRV